jgi:hypothetical protein
MKKWLAWILLALLLAPLAHAQAAPNRAARVQTDRVTYNFPESLTFDASFTADTTITGITLEYGVEQQTCGTVIPLVEPQFTPGTNVSVNWQWEMRQSGSLPPGAKLWWRWVITEVDGTITRTPTQTAVWLDSKFRWQTIDRQGVRLHWYRGDQAFATALHQAAIGSLAILEKDAGLKPSGTIDIYVYGSFEDLRDSVLYEPAWTGGQAFPDHNIFILGVPTNSLEWGKSTIAHEITHILVGNFTFSCLGSVPTWLNEGLAMYAEGGLTPSAQVQFDAAVRANRIFSIRALGGGFSEESTRANLSYSQSYSIVNYLIKTFGQAKMNDLLESLRDGATIDAALQRLYGFDVDGLEDAWRASIGAPARLAQAIPTATPQPTVVPTYVPFSGMSMPAADSATPVVPVTPIPPAPVDSFEDRFFDESVDERSLLMFFGGLALAMCCLGALIVFALVFFLFKGTRREA